MGKPYDVSTLLDRDLARDEQLVLEIDA